MIRVERAGAVVWRCVAVAATVQYAVGRQCGIEHNALRQLAGEEESGNSSGEETDSMAARGQARNNLRPSRRQETGQGRTDRQTDRQTVGATKVVRGTRGH